MFLQFQHKQLHAKDTKLHTKVDLAENVVHKLEIIIDFNVTFEDCYLFFILSFNFGSLGAAIAQWISPAVPGSNPSHTIHGFFKKEGHSWPLFVYYRSFHNTMTNIVQI